MGYQISLSGLVICFFSIFMFTASGKTSRKTGEYFWALASLLSLAAIPVGLVVQIWQ